MKEYLTIGGNGKSRYEDRRSVFLGFAAHTETEKEAIEFIGKTKAEHPEARHHVYAFSLRENAGGKYSDDREPQGSAGLPVLDVIRHSGLMDLCVVVVRYFGGTLLGTGGLVKAYGTAAAEAVRNAGTVKKALCFRLALRLTYPDYQRYLQTAGRFRLVGEEPLFGEDVSLSVLIPGSETDRFLREITEQTSGRIVWEKQEEVFGTFPAGENFE